MLRVYAAPGQVCPWPGQNNSGQIRRYIGRDHKIKRADNGSIIEIGHPALTEAVEIDPASKVGKRIIRLMLIEQEKPLLPADKETAKALGVPLVDVEWTDGEWLPKPAKKTGKDS